MCGSFETPIAVFGADTLRNLRGRNAYVAKLSPAGSWLWARGPAAGHAVTELAAVAVDARGNAYVTGKFYYDSTRFGSTWLRVGQHTASRMLVAKLSSGGAWRWAYQDEGPDSAIVSVGRHSLGWKSRLMP